MNPTRAFELVYAPQVKEHLEAIDSKYYGLIRREIESRLRFEPEIEARARKPLKRAVAFGAEWEIRFGPNNRFRVFYEVSWEAHVVHILAIGVKERNRLHLGKEVIEL